MQPLPVNDAATAPPRRHLTTWLPTLLYMAIIFTLSSFSQPPLPAAIMRTPDKLLHVILYTGFGMTLTWGLSDGGRRMPGWKTVAIATFLALVYGISDETHQRFVPGRSFEIGDMQADMVGGFLGALCVWALSVARRRWQPPAPPGI